jgi:hypothetical protein
MMGKHLFTLPIGDWSNDGHGKSDLYYIESNKPVEEVREAHFKAKDITGIDIEKIANRYEENSIESDHPVIEYLRNKKIDPRDMFDNDEDTYYADSESMVELWVMLLQDGDPNLELKISQDHRVPMLPFYGFDEKKRHIGFVGYGTF